ncbi:peptidoglycan-recognition protein LB [Galleria mellonella]|uniref:Peptidoglycan-recognition protein n=1 Tax=Galleria mellonella TaxID=7137 RepID=A0A6J3BWU0_GALME|nr:peptidoglycan-recognition protein LB [Galleria mellonella]
MCTLKVIFVCCILIMYDINIANSFPSFSIDGKDYPFSFYSRADWNADPSTDVRPLITPAPYVVIHHTYEPPACNDTAQCEAAMKSMQDYHKSLDWGDIGYNFCVGSEGGAYEGRGWEVVGIHAGKANSISIGICLIGDWREQLPPVQQLETTKALIEEGVKRGFISSDYKLIGHRQALPTECPGTALFNHISTWDHFVSQFEPPLTKKI